MGNNWKLHHVGVVVRDMDKAVKYYQSLGIFTFLPEVQYDSSSYAEFEVYGKTPSTAQKGRVRFALIGPYGIELISPTEGNSIYDEFLKSHGEGIEHLCFKVDNLDAEESKLREKNIPIIMHQRRQDGTGATYIDTGKIGNALIELSQRRPTDVV